MQLGIRDQDAIALPLLLLILLVGYNSLVGQPPPISARPQRPAMTGRDSPGVQDISARLWQDPISATRDQVCERLAAAAKECKPGERPCTARAANGNAFKRLGFVWDSLVQEDQADHSGASGHLLVLPVLLRGGPYQEDYEQRLRARYAVISALLECGYGPNDAEALGVLFVPKYIVSTRSMSVGKDDPNRLPEPASAPAALPFEFFRQVADGAYPDRPSRVLVLWMNDLDAPGRLVDRMLRDAVSELHAGMHTERGGGEDFCVRVSPLGPFGSDDLIDIERTRLKPNVRWAPPDHWHVDEWRTASATISADSLRSELGLGKEFHPVVPRAAAADDRIAQLLVKELGRRRFDWSCQSDERVLLIAEADTAYSRRLVGSLSLALGVPPPKPGVDPLPNDRVHCFHYLRGLDGLIPGRPNDATPNQPRRASDLQPQDLIAPRPDSSSRALVAVDDSQYDYLTRLVTRAKSIERDRRTPFTAIGIVGTDYYDKRLILEAMRPEFPGVVFFTTDLDARMLDSSAARACRNLVIAASYGLQIEDSAQGATPPMRDSLQTALFVLTRDVLGDSAVAPAFAVAAKVAAEPSGEQPANEPGFVNSLGSVFEVGRSGFHLIDRGNTPKALTAPSPRMPTMIRSRYAVAAAAILMLGLPAFLIIWRRSVQDGDAKKRSRCPIWHLAGVWALLVAVGALFAGAHYVAARVQPALKGGEPDTWPSADGVNAWPTILMVLIIGLYAAIVALTNLRAWKRHLAEVQDRFHLAPGPSVSRGKEWLVLHWRITGPPSASRLMQDFVHFGHSGRRAVRALLFAAPYLLIAWSLWALGVYTPPMPLRGPWAYHAFCWSHLFATMAIAFLAFLAWDATRLCEAFTMHLLSDVTKYPPGRIIELCATRGLEPRIAPSVLDTWIIGELTEEMGRAIYAPMIALFVLVAARNGHVDNFAWSPVLLVSTSLLALVLIVAMVSLQRAARKVRSEEARRLRELLSRMRHQVAPPQRIDQLQDLIKEIEDFRQGAFANWSGNPVLVSTLVPFGIALLMALLDRLASP